MHNCKNCGRPELYMQRKGTATGLYCMHAGCNKWQKWVKAKDVPQLQATRMPLYNEGETPRLIQPQYESAPYTEDALPPQFGGPDEPVYAHTGGQLSYGQQEYAATTHEEINKTQQQPYNPSQHISNEERNNYKGTEQFYKASNEFYKTLPSVDQLDALCVTCTSGIVPTLDTEDDIIIRLNKSEKLLIITNKVSGIFLSAFKVKFCPTCGRAIE